MAHIRTPLPASPQAASPRTLWTRLRIAGIAALASCAPFVASHAQTLDAYVAAGFKPVLTTTVNGPFTGCTKDQPYLLADGSKFVCGTKRTAFAVNPKATLLQNPDGTVNVLIIDGVAYAGGFSRGTGGMRAASVPTTVEEPDAVKPVDATAAVRAIRPIEPINGILPMRDVASLREEAVQEYSLPPYRRVR